MSAGRGAGTMIRFTWRDASSQYPTEPMDMEQAAQRLATIYRRGETRAIEARNYDGRPLTAGQQAQLLRLTAKELGR